MPAYVPSPPSLPWHRAHAKWKLCFPLSYAAVILSRSPESCNVAIWRTVPLSSTSTTALLLAAVPRYRRATSLPLRNFSHTQPRAPRSDAALSGRTINNGVKTSSALRPFLRTLNRAPSASKSGAIAPTSGPDDPAPVAIRTVAAAITRQRRIKLQDLVQFSCQLTPEIIAKARCPICTPDNLVLTGNSSRRRKPRSRAACWTRDAIRADRKG
jgi:hypothetical protein